MVQHTIGCKNLNGKTQEKIDVISMREYIGEKKLQLCVQTNPR